MSGFRSTLCPPNRALLRWLLNLCVPAQDHMTMVIVVACCFAVVVKFWILSAMLKTGRLFQPCGPGSSRDSASSPGKESLHFLPLWTRSHAGSYRDHGCEGSTTFKMRRRWRSRGLGGTSAYHSNRHYCRRIRLVFPRCWVVLLCISFTPQYPSRTARASADFLSDLAIDDDTLNIDTTLTRASALNDRGNILLAQHEYVAALERYTSALALLPNSVDVHKNILVAHLRLGDSMEVIKHVQKHNVLLLERSLQEPNAPSVHAILGIALYNLNRLDKAAEAFKAALRLVPTDETTWANLGDTLLHDYRVENAVVAHTEAHRLTTMMYANAVTNTEENGHAKKTSSIDLSLTAAALFRAKSWMCDWSGWKSLETRVAQDYASIDPAHLKSYGDFIDVSASVLRRVNTAHALKVTGAVGSNDMSQRSAAHQVGAEINSPRSFRVGFVSSDFGVHPVSSLIRGLIAELSHVPDDNNGDTERRNKYAADSATSNNPTILSLGHVETFVYILTDQTSWWRDNITGTVHHAVDLFGKSTIACADRIKSDRLDVLIDLNGWTMHSGLSILAHRVAPVQAIFLGYSMSTGAPFVDYFIADATAVPVEEADGGASNNLHGNTGHAAAFSEKLLLLPHSFFANDYAVLQSHVAWNDQVRAQLRSTAAGAVPNVPRSPAEAGLQLPYRMQPYPAVIFACFSDFRKMDPVMFDVWMNVLRTTPGSVLWLLRHHKIRAAERRLRSEAAARGVLSDRLVFSDKVAWIQHILVKGIADIVLDTRLVNGHTISADALWGGVPVLTVQGKRMGARVASSLLMRGLDSDSPLEEERDVHHTGMGGLVTMGLKEYENVAERIRSGRSNQVRRRIQGRFVPRRRSRLLRGLKRVLHRARLRQPLFRMKEFANDFESQLRAAVEIRGAARESSSMPLRKAHVYLPPNRRHRSFAENAIELSLELPHDPHLAAFYQKLETADAPLAAINNDKIHGYRPDPVHGLILLHLHGEIFDGDNADLNLSASVQTPSGWQSSPVSDFRVGRAQNSSITAIYATLLGGGGWPGLRFARQLHDAIRPGGALFVYLEGGKPTDDGHMKRHLAMAGFCEIELWTTPFGSFDIRKEAVGERNWRYAAKVCRKPGTPVKVRIQ